MRKKFWRRFLPAILASAVFFGAVLLCRALNHPLYSNFYQPVLTCEFSFLTVVGSIFCISKRKKLPFNQSLASFFFSPVVLTLCMLTLATLIVWFISGDKPETDSSGSDVLISIGTFKDHDPENKNASKPEENSLEQNSSIPYLSMIDWENDPFFLNIDNYCGYHVDDADVSDMIFLLLSYSQSEISVRGPYPSESLNGADSPYADYIRRANELHQGYQLFNENDLLIDYQIKLLEDEISVRKLANNFFGVSNNLLATGDDYLILGNIYKQENDFNKAHECYANAFGVFESAYRTGIAEGTDPTTLQLIVNRMVNTSDKLTALAEMDTREQAMAPKVVAAFKKLLV